MVQFWDELGRCGVLDSMRGRCGAGMGLISGRFGVNLGRYGDDPVSRSLWGRFGAGPASSWADAGSIPGRSIGLRPLIFSEKPRPHRVRRKTNAGADASPVAGGGGGRERG